MHSACRKLTASSSCTGFLFSERPPPDTGLRSEVVMQQHAARRKDWAAWQAKEEELCDEIRDLGEQLRAEQQEHDQVMGRETILEQELRAERRRRIDLEARPRQVPGWCE